MKIVVTLIIGAAAGWLGLCDRAPTDSDNEVNKPVNYFIAGLLQTKSDLYTYPDNTHYRSINRTFDKNNNLIILESKELSLYSSMMSYVLRYKYYD